LQDPGVQKMTGRIASAKDAQRCRQCNVRDKIIVRRQCSESL
jgi:hypothetical protein